MDLHTQKEWISGRAVARELDIHPSSVTAVVLASGIGVRRIPGLDDRYRRADVERVRAQSLAAVGQGVAS